jgi:hypothetical protein
VKNEAECECPCVRQPCGLTEHVQLQNCVNSFTVIVIRMHNSELNMFVTKPKLCAFVKHVNPHKSHSGMQ